MALVQARNRRWYAFAVALDGLDDDTRKGMVPGKGHRAHLARIALLHHGIGDDLDTRRAPFRIFYFVAYAPDRLGAPRLLGQQVRFQAVVKLYNERGRWPLPPALSGLALDVDEQFGHVQPRAASDGRRAAEPASAKASPAETPSRDLNAEARGGVALFAQHPEIAVMLGEFAARRANSASE